MQAEGWLGRSVRWNCGRLGREIHPYQAGLIERIEQAPKGGYLVVDLHPIEHEGTSMGGTHKVYSSCAKGSIWGHNLVSAGLVYPDPQQEVYPLCLSPFPNSDMTTEDYPQLTPSEAMLNVVAGVNELEYTVKAVVVDAQFTTRFALRSLRHLKTPLVGRFRTDSWVRHGGKSVQVRTLATDYPPGKARFYKRFKWYAKRLRVELEAVGFVDLILVWKPKSQGFELLALISTLDPTTGLQTIPQAWKLRWSLEVAHRLYKQNLGIAYCQSRSFFAQLKHYDLTLSAFHRCRSLKQLNPQSSWREVQSLAARSLKSQLLTGLSPVSA